jgi:hypothetical protein
MHGLEMKDVNIVDICHMIEVYLNTSPHSRAYASRRITSSWSRGSRVPLG